VIPIRKFAINTVFSIVAVLASLVPMSIMTVEGPLILDRLLSLIARYEGKPLVTATRYWRTFIRRRLRPPSNRVRCTRLHINSHLPLRFVSSKSHFRLFSLHHSKAVSAMWSFVSCPLLAISRSAKSAIQSREIDNRNSRADSPC